VLWVVREVAHQSLKLQEHQLRDVQRAHTCLLTPSDFLQFVNRDYSIEWQCRSHPGGILDQKSIIISMVLKKDQKVMVH
jgi:hypothetical protein